MLRLDPSIAGAPCRNIRKLAISAELFLEMFKGMDGIRRVQCKGIPDDARTVGVSLDERFNTVVLWVESSEFAPVYESAMAEPLEPTFVLYTGNAQPED